MGISLSEYAAQHPQQEPEPEFTQIGAVGAFKERQQERDQAEQLKESILHQLQQGNTPETILYTAIRAIGLLSQDREFAETGQRYLDSLYADLEQQSLLTDNAAVAARRLEQKQRDYNKRLRNSLNRHLKGYQRIAEALEQALEAVDNLDLRDDE